MRALRDWEAREAGVLEAFRDLHRLALPGEVEAAEFHHVGGDGFMPIRFRRILRRPGHDRHGGESGKGEEGAAVHGVEEVPGDQ